MRNLLTLGLTIFSVSAATSFPVFAQEAEVEDKPKCLFSGEGLTPSQKDNDDVCLTSSSLLGALDLTTPESALFTLMGSTPDNVLKPKLGDKISWSFLPQAINALDGEEFALGFEINPGLLMLPESYSIANLRGRKSNIPGFEKNEEAAISQLKWVRLLSQFTLSGAASKSTGDVDMTRYGFGINFAHDTGSPMFGKGKYAECVMPSDWVEYRNQFALRREAEERKFKARVPAPSSAELADFITNKVDKIVRESDWHKLAEKGLNKPKSIDKCVEEEAPWNRTVFGAGAALYHSDVEVGDAVVMAMADMDMAAEEMVGDQTGYGIWASAAIKTDDQGQLTVSARFNDDLVRERTVMEEAMTESVDGWRFGARYTRGFSESDNAKGGAIKGFIEAAYAEEDFGIINDSFTQAGVGVEIQLQDNLFFQATIGDTFGSEIDRSTYLSGQFKWSFSKAAAK